MFLKTVLVVLLVGLVNYSKAQVGVATCTYEIVPPGNVYQCRLVNQNIQSEQDMQTVAGIHLPESTNLNVTRLSMTNSVIRVFPSVIINQFANLREVILPASAMQSFDSGITNCDALQTVDISYNVINMIASQPFANCRALRELHLKNNSINHIIDGAFNGLQSLNTLDLSSNRIRTLTPPMIMQLSALVTLDLHNNELQEFNAEIFALTQILQYLRLENNQLATWNMAALEVDHPRLESIGLAGNRFITIPANAFARFTNLGFLSIGDNILTFPTLTNVPRLATLILDNNRLTVAEAEAFRNMQNLHTLSMVDNEIASVNFTQMENDAYLLQLRVLRLSGNRITSLHDNNFSLLRLTTLDLSRNQMTRINSGDLRPVAQMRDLNVANNRIVRIERGFFDGITQKTFRATGNVCFNEDINIVNNFETFVPRLAECFSMATSMKVSFIALFVSLLLTFGLRM